MKIKDYLKRFDITYADVLKNHNGIYQSIYERERNWMGLIENKLHLITDKSDTKNVLFVINKIKSGSLFEKSDIEQLSTFVKKIDKVTNVINRINNFKQGTPLENNSSLELHTLFNNLRKADTIKSVGISLNSNLNNFLPHLFSIIKHIQNPVDYPIYYLYWKNILKKVFGKDDDYDSMCEFYRTLPNNNRHLIFGSYLRTIGNQIVSNFKKNFPNVTKESQEYKQLIKDVINLKALKNLLDSEMEKSETIINKLLINITWNSKDWKEESNDTSNHRWVKDGGTPGESLNFAKDANQNTNEHIFGYAKFTHAPKIEGSSIFIFYSQGRIVGFYGNAKLTNKETEDGIILNLRGDKNLSFVLENKIDNVKEYGFLEDKERVGMINFTYLNHNKTVISILNESLELNPNQKDEILKLKKWFVEITDFTEDINDIPKKVISRKETMNIDNNLNQILYGPPGTGKTYNTINKAISIVNPSFDLTTNRDIVKKEYDRLLELGHIVFTTFHQSMSYEDFIEGIKPETTPSGNVIYNVKDGIFKELCEDAKNNNDRDDITNKNSFLTSQEFDKQFFYKLSLGNSNDKNDREIYEYCIENNCIALGYGGMIDYAQKNTKEIYDAWQTVHKDDSTTPSYVNYFVHIIKIGDYVIISNGNRKIRAMAKVTGDYFIDLEAPIRYKHFRKVEWIFSRHDILSSEVYEPQLSQSTLYQLKKAKLNKAFFTSKDIESNNQQLENYVIIIDEINRGNISQIFGELITLIEHDKRLGNDESLQVTLPYSNDSFGIPSNIYILGTMNTADRSVESLDTALRRRFCFEEMLPNHEVLNGKEISGIDLKELLSTINKRVEILLDRDHTIGHSYFINIKSEDDLKNTFKNNIIPLLQEYFYGDYEKIGMIIGDAFFEDTEKYDKNVFANFPSLNYPETGSILRIKIINESFDIIEALKELLKK